MITITLPSWASNLRAQLQDDDEEFRLNAVAEVCGLPPITSYPRPRQAANFEIRDWRSYASENGFVEIPQSKHAFQFSHKEFPTLRWGCSTTPGDFRSSMASATQNRNIARLFYGRLLMVMLSLMSKPEVFLGQTDLYSMDIPTFITYVKRIIVDPALLNLAFEIAREARTSKDIAPPADVRHVLRCLQKEFHIHPRRAFQDAGVSVESTERIISVLDMQDDSRVQVFRDIYANLVDLLEGKRDEEVQSELQKKRERMEVVNLKIDEPKPSDTWAMMGKNMRADVTGRVKSACDVMSQHVANCFRDLLKSVDSGLALPPLPPGVDDIEMLRQQAFAAQEELRQSKEKLDQLDAIIKERDELKVLLESSDETDPWRARLRDFLSFLTEKKLDQDHGPRALTKILDDVIARMDVEIQTLEQGKVD